jgi:hypothetical protein
VWKTTVASGTWELGTNWTGTGPPDGTNSTAIYSTATITVNSNRALGSVINFNRDNANVHYGNTAIDLTIASGYTVSNSKGAFMCSSVAGAKATITISETAKWNFATGTSGNNFFVSSGGTTGNKSVDIVNVYGTLDGTTGTVTTIGLVLTNTATGTGSGTVNIYDTGVVKVRTYTIGTTGGTGRIYIEMGGYMWINGDKRTQVSADITNSRIQKLGAEGTLEYDYDAGTTRTWVTVTPEPATVALLGLGGLMLCRKKR